jgi:hypothetical protein
MLFFARLLDSVRKYSCAAAVFDSFFVLDPSSSASIATVALANGDLIRGVFHYHQALRHLIAQGSVDEVLYLAQALVGIYVGRWHLSPAMSVLTYILRATYSLAVDQKRERKDCCASGSLKLPRAVVKPPEFTPDPAAAASILTGIALVAVFGKLGLFTAAATLLVKLQSATDNTAILRVLTYLQLWLAHRQNDAARLSQLAISIDVRRASAAVNSEFKVVNRVNFDPDLAALRLLARSCIDRGHPALGLFWAEMFIQSHQAARANELGKGFALRGAALLALLDHLPAGLSHVDVPDAVGRWTTATDPSKEQIFAQAIASLTLACAYFSRVGKTYPFWRTRLMLLDAAMDRPLDRLPAIAMFAQCATAGRTDFPSHDAPNVSQIAKDAVVAMARLMHPILLMFAQVCACRAEITAGNRDNAKTYFDFASGNFIRLFVAGPKFLGTELSLKNLTLVDRFLRRLCEEALELGPAVTNDKLDLFDVMNDVACLITDRRRTVRRDDVVLIVPSLDLHVSVLDFERGEPRTFGEILSAGGFLDKSLGHGPPTISDLVASIACNNRLADNQKLSEDDMTTMNYQFCRQIESRAEAIRRDRSAQIPPESSFAYLARSCPMAVNTIFIQRLLGRIAVYVPSTGNVRYVPVEPADEWGTVSVPIHRPECTFRTGSQLFAASFAEYVAELIHFEGAAAKARVRLGTLPVDIFGDLLNQCAPTQTDTIRIAGQFDSFIRVKADQPPIVFITSVDLGPVPFEVLFPNRVIVRAPSYSSLVFRLAKSPSRPIPTPVVLRHPLDSFKAACGRVVDIVGYVMHDLCDGPPISGAGSGERYSPLATILFKSGTTEAVQKRWQFARIIEHAPQWSEFFIFSFADLAEMSPVIRRVFSEFPSAFCMFIPGAYMKEAFRIIGKVYQMSPPPTRHRKSATLLPPREVLFESMYQFIVSLQRMLMRILKIPVPLFVHL